MWINKCPKCGKTTLHRGFLFVGLLNPGPVRFQSKSNEIINTNSYACLNCGYIEISLDTKARKLRFAEFSDSENKNIEFIVSGTVELEEEIPI
jgi:hypothetical protein